MDTRTTLLLILKAVPVVLAFLFPGGYAEAGWPPWATYSGPLSEVSILLVQHAGPRLGSDSLLIQGSGVVVRTNWTLPPGSRRREQRVQRGTFRDTEFVALVNTLYAGGFFQLDQSYELGPQLHLTPSGDVRVQGELFMDFGYSELIVRLGNYAKRVAYIDDRKVCPDYVKDLEEAVMAFSVAHMSEK